MKPLLRFWRGLLGVLGCAITVLAAAETRDERLSLPALQAAQRDYILHCGGCHRFDGRGSPRHGIPDFRASVGWFTHLPEGRQYLVRVPGSSQSQLTDAELAAVINWMLLSFSAEQLPADFTPFTPQEVTRARTPAYPDVVPVRRALEQALAADGRVLAEYSYGAHRKP